MIVRTLIQWHTEKDGIITWRNPGDVTDETVADLDRLIAGGTVEPVGDPEPTLIVRGGRRTATPSTEGSVKLGDAG